MISWLRREKPPRQFPLCNFDRISAELRPCDVVLVEGRSRVSDVIRWLTNSPWTHAALYIGRLADLADPDLKQAIAAHYNGHQGDQLVIESLLGFGTIVRSLTVYEHEHLRICRPSRLSNTDAVQVIRYASSQLGVGYDVRQILDLARFLMPWYLLPKKWASTLFLSKAGRREKTVCSTMIAEAFGFVNFPILPLVKHSEQGEPRLFRRNPRLCTPSDFDYSPYFEIIKYPFMDFYRQDYHLLPWKGPGKLSPEELDYYIDDENQDDFDDIETDSKDASASEKRP